MIIRNKSDLKQAFSILFKQAESLLSCEKQVKVEVSEFIRKRTLEQNAYYWLICGEVGSFLDEAGLYYGEFHLKYNGELVHEINKSVFGKKTTTKMNVCDFCDYLTEVIQFWQEKTNFEWVPSELPVGYLVKKGYCEKDFL